MTPVRVGHGQYFEDFTAGDTYLGSSRTITDAEISVLACMLGALNPLFLDEEHARQTVHGGRILYGPAVLGIAIGLTEAVIHGTVLALLGIDEVRFRRSVRSGDTITAQVEVVETRPSSEPGRGVIRVRDTVTNQRGELVLEFRRSILVAARPLSPGLPPAPE
jgi:acyl dehydratase